jgi:riboflavin synthase
MFTGLISDVGEVTKIVDHSGLRRMRIACSYPIDSIAIGASIACAGPCLTAVATGTDERGGWFEVDAAAETLARTTVGTWTVGQRINLERSLKIGDELGGHIVTGHVDGMAEVVARVAVTPAESSWATARFDVRVPRALSRFVAEKGSVCLDGTSLTVNTVVGDVLSVLLIPHTLQVTTWGMVAVGDQMNIEVDLMARYAARLAETAPHA